MEIAEIKQQLSIITVLEHYGIRINRNKMVCCPFHDDKNPSMQVYSETNTVFLELLHLMRDRFKK